MRRWTDRSGWWFVWLHSIPHGTTRDPIRYGDPRRARLVFT